MKKQGRCFITVIEYNKVGRKPKKDQWLKHSAKKIPIADTLMQRNSISALIQIELIGNRRDRITDNCNCDVQRDLEMINETG